MQFSVKSMSCRRGGKSVFRDIGFAIASGEAVVVTGANGSGKSSLLRVLAGLIPAHQGEAEWNGAATCLRSHCHKSRVVYIGHNDPIKPDMTARENVAYWAAIMGVAADPRSLEPMDMGRLAATEARKLSAGQRKKLSLARLSFSQKAVLWLLDEPLTALDAEGQRLFFSALTAHRKSGGMAIIASHHEAEPENSRHLRLSGESL